MARVPKYPQKEVVAQNGVVAACDARAAEWGLRVLEQGGNAADAGVVTGFLMAVYEPWNCGLGGHGGHMAFYDARSREYVGIDGSSRTPLQATADMFKDELMEPFPTHPGDVFRVQTRGDVQRVGFRAMFAPTTVSQYDYLLRRFGTLSLSEAVEPAARVAEEGFEADEIYARAVNGTVGLLERLGNDALLKPFVDTFQPGRKPIQPGQKVRNAALAATLRRLGEEGAGLFYHGDVADQVVNWVQKNGGILTREDFTAYDIETGPLTPIDYRGYRVLSYPQCANGATIAEALRVLENFPLRAMGFGTAPTVHAIIEALKIAFTDRYAYVSDRDFVPVPYDGLMSWGYGRDRARIIDPSRAQEFEPGNPWAFQASGWRIHGMDLQGMAGAGPTQVRPDAVDDDTTFLTAVDRDRNMVLVTSSNGAEWGCKVVVPGLGFALNNSMRAANPVPDHVLSIAPFKRILRNSGPIVIERDGHPWTILSAPGGRKIISSVVTTVVNLLDYEMGVQAAIDAPRLHTEAYGKHVEIEDGIRPEVLERLRSVGHELEVVPQFENGFARMQAIRVDMGSGLLYGASEPRTHGGARGY